MVLLGSSLIGFALFALFLTLGSAQSGQRLSLGSLASILTLAVLTAVFLAGLTGGTGRVAARLFNLWKLCSARLDLKASAAHSNHLRHERDHPHRAA